MTKTKSKLLVSATVLASLTLYNQAINADTTQPSVTPAIQTTNQQQNSQEPKVVDVQVTGEPNTETVGTEVFDPITVTVKTDHFTNDNLLTQDGLGWTDETEVQPIKGTATGIINNSRYWGQNNPTEPVTAYTFNNGDSGRITNVGETLAGTKLDLIYTVEDSDKDDWMTYSGFGQDKRVKGLAFTGEQYIKDSSNNSIVVLYNGANYIDIKYQLVRHNTLIEQPVLVSFITTDIDVGQGVATDLANLALVIPNETNLSIQDGVIYDSSHTGPYHYGADINGANGLPYGGYLGVAFLSHFNYTFFAPAPANDDIYKFATGVRYDLFGSALQTKLVINRQTHLTVKYVDDEGNEIQPATKVTGTNDYPQVPSAPTIKDYQLNDAKTNIISPDEEEIIYQYLPEYHLTVEYLDEQGNRISPQQELSAVKGALVQLKPISIEGYQLPTMQSVIVSQNDTIKFVYSKQQLQTKVEYVDEQGNILSEPQEITSTYGSRITIQPVQITGFTAPAGKTVDVTANQTIQLVYTRKIFPIQIQFVDQNGHQLQSEETITAKYGEELSVEPAMIDGYAAPDKQELTVEKAQTITFVYHKIVVAHQRLLAQAVATGKNSPVRIVRQSNVGQSVPATIRTSPVIVRNTVRAQPTKSLVYRSTVQVQPRLAQSNSVPKLPTINFKIYNPTKHVNKQVQKKKIQDKFQQNTGMNKSDQKVFFDVLKAIDKDGKKRGLNQQQRNLEMAYYIAGISYTDNDYGSKLQRSTSQVYKYNYKALKRIVGESKAKAFYKVAKISGDNHKVDLPHLMVTLASAKDQNWISKTIHTITTFPDQIRSLLYLALYHKNLTNTHGLPSNIEQWLFVNGYYGDKIADHKISQEDLHADLDSYFLVNSKGSLARSLWKLYNLDPQALAKKRRLQERGMAERTKQTRNAKVGTIVVGALSLSTLGLGLVDAIKNRRRAKEAAKSSVRKVIDRIKQTSRKFAKDVKTVLRNQRQAIRKTIRTLPSRLTQAARKQVQSVRRGFNKAVTNARRIVRPVQRIVRRVTRPVINRVKRVATSVRRTVRRVTRTVRRTYHKVTQKVTRTVRRVANRVKRIFRRRR